MMQVLGEGWAFVVTDVTRGTAGNYERLAFVFDGKRVRLSGLACELVVAAEEAGIGESVLKKQCSRTPYAASFVCESTPFTLVTLHVTWGESPKDRVPELEEIALWLARWGRGSDPWGTNLIALGDFNIDRNDDPLYQAFTGTGLQPPDPLNHVPRTVFDDPDPEAPPEPQEFLRSDSVVHRHTGRPGSVLPIRQRGDVQLRRRSNSSRQHHAVVVARLGSLSAVGGVRVAASWLRGSAGSAAQRAAEGGA